MKKILILYSLLCCLVFNAQDFHAITLTTENGLPSDQIYCAIEDSKGFIWIGTKNGVVRWDSKNFEYFTIKNGLPNNEVIKIFEDSKGRVWFISFNKSVSYFFNGKIYNGSTNNKLNSINPISGSDFIEYKNKFYFEGEFNKLYSCDLNNFSIYKLDSNHHYSFFKYNNNLIVSYNEYPFLNRILDSVKFKIGELNFYKIKLKHQNLQLNKSIYNKYKTVFESGYKLENYLSVNENVFIKSLNDKLFIHNKNRLDILQDKKNISKFIDGSILKIYSVNDKLFFMNDSLNIKSLFSNKMISSLKEKGKLYNVICYKDFAIITLSTGIYIHKNKISKIEIKNINYNQIAYLNKKIQKKHISISLKYSIFHDTAFYISHAMGIFKLSSNNTFQLNERKTYSCYIDTKNQIWYNDVDRVYFAKKTKTLIYDEKSISLNSKFKVFVNEIKEDKFGNMIFATNNGVYLYNTISKRKYCLNEDNLLSSNECNRIEIDLKDNSLWISTFNGLNHIQYYRHNGVLKFKLINRFFKDDGLLVNEINDFLITGDSIWIATSKGVNLIHNKNYKPDSAYIPLYINQIWVNNENVENLDKLKSLKNDENNLFIDYSPIYYQRRGRLSVYYRLISDHDTIIKFISDNRINLIALRDGNYKLQLFAFDKDYHYIQSKLVTIKFSIFPPFYKTWWFLGGIISLLILILFYFYYRKIVQEKNRELERMQNQSKINEYRLRSLQSQMNPHFIFNSLNTIQHFIYSKNDLDASNYLSNFSKLIREMLDNTRNDLISLDKEINFVKRYVELELIRYHNKFQVEFSINLIEDITEIFIPTMLIQPIIENAIKHGVANLESKQGVIHILFKQINEDFVEISVVDNGIGEDKNKKKSHKSSALQIIKDRLELYNIERKKGEISINYTDRGTSVLLIIPI